MQYYHTNARTNIHIRREIQNSLGISSQELAQKYNVSVPTILKWKHRNSPNDETSRPKSIRYALSDELQALAVSVRKTSWLSLDEVWEMMLNIDDKVSRISVYRIFKKHNINTLPTEIKEKAQTFKEYSPGFLHMDITYLPKIEGKKSYLFVAIDRATRLLFFKVYEQKTADNTQDFLEQCRAFFPFKITHILTDNGLEFTNKLHRSKKGNATEKPSKFDEKCKEYQIDHRLTRPATPKTNGMVERVNGIIKSATIAKVDYQSQKEMKTELTKYLIYYNTMRRHGSLRRELGVKTPLQALEKWYKINPNIFYIPPLVFSIYLANFVQNS